jgi:hypothetical protein
MKQEIKTWKLGIGNRLNDYLQILINDGYVIIDVTPEYTIHDVYINCLTAIIVVEKP